MERKFHVSNRKSISKVRSHRRPGCIRLFVCPSTGGRLEISVSPKETILGIKTALARKLKIPPSRITLIYKDKVLTSGSILDHQVPDDSQITLVPNMEAGLSLQPSDKNIMQALENLTETQVNDFLSGRSPLMLAIRMGDHMVFVQLQLSSLHASAQAQASRNGSSTSAQSAPTSPATASLLSHTGLSASALAEATRCLSQRLQRLQEMNRTMPRRVPSEKADIPCTSSAISATSEKPTLPESSMSLQQRLAPAPQPSPVPPPPLALPKMTSPSVPNLGTTSNLCPIPSLPSPPPSPGAVIDNIKHVGRGIYTGSFTGTLDRSLQDSNGQPRRSVHTILHILNDLLVAAPGSPTQINARSVNQTNQAPPTSVNGMLTPPSSPVNKTFAGSVPNPTTTASVESTDNADNALLRGKMQHVREMMASRKQQRKTRREVSTPYFRPSSPKDLSGGQQTNNSALLKSSDIKSCRNPGDEGHTHECCGTYCKPNLEQDTLAV